MKLALDIFGGDNSPKANIEGAITYLKEYSDSSIELILVGDENIIQSTLDLYSFRTKNIHILHASEIVGMNEKPSRIFREKPNSSLVKTIQLVQEKKAHAAISAGNTGALLTSSLFLIGKIPGIRRPAFAPFIPSSKGGFILCDAGANADSKPQDLVQFAIMASSYMEHLENRHNPNVALLNIGSEKGKGNELTIATYPLMQEHIKNFIGNIEARYILEGNADIVICDGFTGNIVLKLTEGITTHLINWFQNLYDKNDKSSQIETLSIFKTIKDILDHEEHGATPLLGINGIVMKCHGSATSRCITNSLLAAQKTVQGNLINHISSHLSKHVDIIDLDKKVGVENPI